MDAEGDLAWVKDLATWELGGPVPPGYYDHWINAASGLERENGHILLAGVGGPIPDQGMEAEYGVGVMELDAFGNPLCFELVTPVFADDENGWTSATTNAAGEGHIAYWFTSDPELFYTYMAGIGELCLPEVEVEDLFPLPDGGVVGVVNTGSDLILKSWSATVEPLWSQTHIGAADHGALLKNGQTILVPGVTGTRSFSAVDGTYMGTAPGALGHVTVAGADSLLYCGADGLSLWTSEGALLWQVPLDLPVTDPGNVSARALRTGDGITVYGGVSEGQSTTSLVTLRYTLSGTYAGAAIIHPNDGSVPKVHALAPLADGGSLGVATTGTGTTRLVRCNATGDTLWTRHFGADAFDPAYPAVFHAERLLELPDGRLLLAGVTQEPQELVLLTLNDSGLPICTETVSAVADQPTYAMALDAGDQIRVLWTSVPVTTTLYTIPQTTLCLVTEVDPVFPGTSCMEILHTSRGFQVDRTDCPGGAVYTIHDVLGREHALGQLPQGMEWIAIPDLPFGMYVLGVVDAVTGERTSVKWAVDR